RARKKGIRAEYAAPLSDRSLHEEAIAKIIDEEKCGLVCLAGYMRLVTKYFVEKYRGRLMNIHPSLLPSFGGAHGQKDALEHGVKVSGCTIHFVDEGMDSGPIIIQAAVAVSSEDTVETLSERILKEEHRAYPEAIRLFAEGRLKIEGRKVKISR
ncbi:MAG: phosphoribosylglycinamide formyltransferase, partial [Candidatus Firestonebacteria bacterium]